MYLNHFKFTSQPYGSVTRRPGMFLIPYLQDIFGLLLAKIKTPGMMGLFSAEPELLSAFIENLREQHPCAQTLNAFPKLSGNTLLYKLNPATQTSKNKLHAVDAVLRLWQEESPSRRQKGKLLMISTAEAIKDNCWDVLAMLLVRAEESGFPLTILLTGSPEQESRLLNHSGLRSRVHTCHTLRPLTCGEFHAYVEAQTEAHQAETSPLTPARVRRMHALTRGQVSQLNKLAHLAMLAAWTERAATVSPRHLRLAAGEIIPARPRGRRFAAMGLLTSVAFACCAGYFSSALTAHLPVPLPVPVAWHKTQPKTDVPREPTIERDVVNLPDAMHQLYTMWGYDASANDALCQNAGRVNLMCRQGNASLAALEKAGYPWIGELKTGDHLNYAVVARVEKDTLDLLVNNRTWQVSKRWFNQHATGNYTLLHRLTPQGKDEITAASGKTDLNWLDQELSQLLHEPVTHAQGWTADLARRTREFQGKTGLHVDGIVGEETLMQLMRAANSTPGVVTQTATVNPPAKTQGKPQ